MEIRYVVQCQIILSWVDDKEYKIRDYALKYCKKMNDTYKNLKFRVVEVIYEEI